MFIFLFISHLNINHRYHRAGGYEKIYIKLIAILWDSELNTRKACLHSEHDNNDGGKSSDTEILDRPAKIIKSDNQNVPSSTSNKLMGEAELISMLHNYIKSLGDADTLE
jgi:hypothetical protein